MGEQEIWIIGTDPPCPRCAYLTRMVLEAVFAAGVGVRVRHMSFRSVEAETLAARLEKVLGTAHDVAARAGIFVDWDGISRLLGDSPVNAGGSACCGSGLDPADRWTPALDKALRPCQDAAESVGMLMTPILVFDGQVRHHGSVPAKEQVQMWISTFIRLPAVPKRITIEVLGQGCVYCDTLQKNVLAAIDQSGCQDKISLKKIQDPEYFRRMGVFATPGLVINGQVVAVGRLLKPENILEMIRAASQEAGSRCDLVVEKVVYAGLDQGMREP